MKLLATGWVTALLAQPAGVFLALTLLVVVLIMGSILVWVLHGVPFGKAAPGHHGTDPRDSRSARRSGLIDVDAASPWLEALRVKVGPHP